MYIKKKKKKKNKPSYLVKKEKGLVRYSGHLSVILSGSQYVTMNKPEFWFDEVECLRCGHIGLTSTKHCKKCYQAHRIEYAN